MDARYSKDPQVETSLRHSFRDAVAYAVMFGGGETYFSAFAIFLKASAAQIAVLATLPPLLGSLAQLFSAWLGRRRRRKPIIVWGACLQAAVWVPLAWLPLAFPEQAMPLLLGCVILYYGAGHLISPQWSSLMGDLVPERRRGRFFAARTRYHTAATFIALLGAGGILHFFDQQGATATGFIAVFMTAAAARMVSAYYLARMIDPPAAAPLNVLQRGGIRRLFYLPVARFSLFFALMQGAAAIASPFFAVYMLRDLQFSYLEFMANTAMSVLVQFLTLNAWGRISDTFGNRFILIVTGSLLPALPLLWLVSTDFWYLLWVQAIAGLAWAGLSLSAGNFLYDSVPSSERASYLAFHNVLAGLGVFLGGLFGGWLSTVLPARMTLAGLEWAWVSPLYGAFVVSALARGCITLAFLPRLKEVRTVRPLSVSGLVFRVVRIRPLTGLIYDIVSLPRRNKRPR